MTMDSGLSPLLSKGSFITASRVQQKYFAERLTANDLYTDASSIYNLTPNFINDVSRFVHVLSGFHYPVKFRGEEIKDLLMIVGKGEVQQYNDSATTKEERIEKGDFINLNDFFQLTNRSNASTEFFVIPDSIHNKLDGVFLLVLDRKSFMQSVFAMDKERFGLSLNQMPLFGHCSLEEIKRLSLHAKTEVFKQDDIILQANDNENYEAFFVISGYVFQKSDSALIIKRPGDNFGHDSLTSPNMEPCPFSYEAITESTILKIDLSALQKSHSVMNELSNKLKKGHCFKGDVKSHEHHSPRHTHHHDHLKHLVDEHKADFMAVNAFEATANHKRRHHHHDTDNGDDFSMPIGNTCDAQDSICSLESILWWVPGLYPVKPKRDFE